MATVTTAKIFLPKVEMRSGWTKDSSKPWATMTWTDVFTIPSKTASNENAVQFVINMLPNYAFRLKDLRMQMFSDGTGPPADFQPAAQFRVTTQHTGGSGDAPGYNFTMGPMNGSALTYKWAPDTVTLDFETNYQALHLPQIVFDGRTTDAINDIPRVLGFFIDSSSDSTSVVDIALQGYAEVFTIEQFISGNMEPWTNLS